MSLGARLTRLRLDKGESLQQVADAVGVSKAHIWELEKGRTDNPSMALVTRLADLFRQAKKLTPEELALLDDMMRSLLKRRRKTGPGGP